MKLVLDPVVLVRGLMGPHGPQGRLLFDPDLDFEWIVSPEIAEEYRDVLGRPYLQRRFRRLGTRTLESLLQQLGRATIVVPKLLPPVCRDPHDDMFLAAAVAGQADYIVSEDLDLRSLGEHDGIGICTASAMLARLSGNDVAPAEPDAP